MVAGTTVRNAGCIASAALVLTCILSLPANARQDSEGGSTSAKKKATTPRRRTSSSSTASVKKSSAKTAGKHARRKPRVRGQEKIDSARAQAIQDALIREHYLAGNPTGKWNEACEDAMRRYQADHGWQSKTVPDSRALISLGLGPSKDHLLNPESAMTTTPDSLRSVSASHPAASTVSPTTSTSPAGGPPSPQ